VLHLSVGAAPRGSFTADPLALAVESAVEQGLVVVAAAGNHGVSGGEEVFGGILSPANHPFVITVGASDSAGTAARSDDRVADFSSRGPTLFDGLGKPDVLAPGADLALDARTGSRLWTAVKDARGHGTSMLGSGTSFAAPVVSGI